MAQEFELIKNAVVYTVENHKVIDWTIIRVNRKSIRCKNSNGEIRTIHNVDFYIDKQKATLRSQGIDETFIVSFHVADELMNVHTGDTEEFHCKRRDNMFETTNYIVKLENKDNYVIEYDLFPKKYCRFEPEPPVTLYDYLYSKCVTLKEPQANSMYDKILFQCPATAESYTWEHIKQKHKEDLKVLLEEFTKE